MRTTLLPFSQSFAALMLTAMCLASCDSGSVPPPKQQEKPAPAPAPQAPTPPVERDQEPAPAPKGEEARPGAATKQPPRATRPATPQSPGVGRGVGAAHSFSVYALSRGSGVPAAAREAQQKVQELVESDRARGVDVGVTATRIGLEGERKLCVTYVDAQKAASALERVRAMVQGIELVNVVVEPCGPRR